jgi:hypothetical protein
MKTYITTKYPVAIIVRVTPYDTRYNQPWIDGIKGLNVGHALHEAQDNWPLYQITLLAVGDLNDCTKKTIEGK